MRVKVRDGRVVDIRGEELPGWDGRLCGKAFAGILGRVYAPDRILQPLKRIGERGEGRFIPCTWDEVIEAVAERLRHYIQEGHPESFEIWWGCPRQQDNMYFIHYWSAVMRTGISYIHGQICFGDHLVEKVVTFGGNHASSLVHGVADLLRTRIAVIAGQNFPGTTLFASSCAVPTYALVNEARRRGCKFIVVDPKLSDTSPWCDEWIPIRPGCDAVMVMLMIKTLIDEALIDEDFLLRYTNAPQLIGEDGKAVRDGEGRYLAWDEESSAPTPLPPAGERGGITLGLGRILEVEGVDGPVRCKTALQLLYEEAERTVKEHGWRIAEIKERVIQLALELGANRPSVVVYPGFTSGRYSNWFQTLRAYSALNLLLGNIDRPGGFYILKHIYNLGVGWPRPPEVPDYLEGREFVPGPWGNLMDKRLIDKAPCYKTPRDFHPSTQALPWLHFKAIEEGKIRAILSTAENSAVTQPDSKWVWECLKKLDLIVVGDQLPKEFIDLADYVIPEASYIERFHLYQRSYLGVDDREHLIIYMRSAAIPPQGDSKPLSWFLIKVAERLGMNRFFKDLDLEYGWWDRMLREAGLYPRVTSRRLIEEGPYHESHPLEYNVLFKPIGTRSGRFEIYSNELSEECYHNPKSRWFGNPHVHPIPRYIPIAEPRGRDEFYLIGGKAVWHQKSATQHNRALMEDAIEAGCPYTAIYINAERARKLGLRDGDLVELECVGPRSEDDPCVIDERAIGVRERGRIRLTEALHPDALWIYFAAGHRSRLMLKKAGEGVVMNMLIPYSVSPYSGGCGKNYSIVKLRRVED